MLTFDQWIDAVDQRVKQRLAPSVKTQELGFDSAWWTGNGSNVAASLADDGLTAHISCDGGDRFHVAFQSAAGDPTVIGDRIADQLIDKR
jgi:hypothetical protein